jgi:hypothetical protein
MALWRENGFEGAGAQSLIIQRLGPMLQLFSHSRAVFRIPGPVLDRGRGMNRADLFFIQWVS